MPFSAAFISLTFAASCILNFDCPDSLPIEQLADRIYFIQGWIQINNEYHDA